MGNNELETIYKLTSNCSQLKLRCNQNQVIKDKADLRQKLEEGIKDSESGKVYSIDEAFSEIDTRLGG